MNIVINHDSGTIKAVGQIVTGHTISELLAKAMAYDVIQRSKGSGKAPLFFWEEIDKELAREKLASNMYEVLN